ncbi:unnamed protein product [Caenorhabditis auriculariae]|uniref:HIT-type domain-containing protein n=1 Tax=Caenorhabditis auriculariae TaxID=2777116 RepID=A0A8S1HAX5_9PELO|nr:unnamed protein product [Caenorhabditis auriculariae]
MTFAPPRRSAVAIARQSVRISNLDTNKILDDSIRKQRQSKQIEGLELDNVQEDPHANIIWNKAAPKFEDEMIGGNSAKKGKRGANEERQAGGSEKPAKPSRKRKMMRPEFQKQRFRKPLLLQIAEQSKAIRSSQNPDFRRVDAYERAQAPPTTRPPRRFCAVCGFKSNYNCTKCGLKYCSIPCRDIHNDTRCMRWTS